jgi:predicted DNA-binding protein
MATATRKTRAQMTRELATDHVEDIARAQVVTYVSPQSPVSVRLSAPLLEALDRLAREQHRKRGNLIQHILWEYVQAKAR